MSDTYFLVFGIIVSLIGIALIVIHFRDLINCREKITATISNLKVEKVSVRGSSVSSYCPKFTYEVDGQTYNGIATFTTNTKNKYKVGDGIEICYNSKNPGQYRMPGRFKSLVFGIIIAAIGMLFVGLNFI